MLLRRVARTLPPSEPDGHFLILALLGVRITPTPLSMSSRSYSQFRPSPTPPNGRTRKNTAKSTESSKRTLCELATMERAAYTSHVTASTSSAFNLPFPHLAVADLPVPSAADTTQGNRTAVNHFSSYSRRHSWRFSVGSRQVNNRRQFPRPPDPPASRYNICRPSNHSNEYTRRRARSSNTVRRRPAKSLRRG